MTKGFIDDCQSDGAGSDAGQINYDFDDYIGREGTPVKRTSDGKIREKTPELPNLFKAPNLIKKPKDLESEEEYEEVDEEDANDEIVIEMSKFPISQKSSVFKIVNWPYNKDDPEAFYRMCDWLDTSWFYNNYYPLYGCIQYLKYVGYVAFFCFFFVVCWI